MDASCSASNANALKQLVNHSIGGSAALGQARPMDERGSAQRFLPGTSVQQERMSVSGADAFFAQQQPAARKQQPHFAFQNNPNQMAQLDPFQFAQMRGSLPQPALVAPNATMANAVVNTGGWADDFMGIDAMETAFQQSHPSEQSQQPTFRQQPHTMYGQAQPQFQRPGMAMTTSRYAGPLMAPQAVKQQAAVRTESHLLFEQAFEEAATISNTLSTDMAKNTALNDWSANDQHQNEINLTGDADTLLQKTAAHLIQTVNNATNSKFANSKFLEFMKQIRDGEVGIEGNKVVERTGSPESYASSKVASKAPLRVSDDWVKEVGGYGLSEDQKHPLEWTSDFMNMGTRSVAGGASELGSMTEASTPLHDGDYSMLEEAFRDFYNETGTGPAARTSHLAPAIHEARVREWEDLNASWAASQAQLENGLGLSMEEQRDQAAQSRLMVDPLSTAYDFIPANPYTLKPLAQLRDLSTHQNLSDSILSLEAAVQMDPSDATAWKNLGLRQQENENEVAAITALRTATELDPTLLDSWIALAVSYTNDSMYSEAYKALEGWIAHNPAYANLISAQPRTHLHDFLTDLYLAAVRTGDGQMDPGLQMGLGILFNISSEHEKALDCFRACLALHPQDYMLWNKLGATLANARQPARALEAYERALRLNPDFLRARYNVAIALVQMGRYTEGVEHLLSILEAQERNVASIVDGENGMGGVGGGIEERLWQLHSLSSASTWNTLGMIMDRYLNRPDLAQAALRKDLDAFRNESP